MRKNLSQSRRQLATQATKARKLSNAPDRNWRPKRMKHRVANGLMFQEVSRELVVENKTIGNAESILYIYIRCAAERLFAL